MPLRTVIDRVDHLKAQVDALRPIDSGQEARVMQMLGLDWNYHSNAIEGNTLTLGETRAFLLHGITAKGKPFRDYLDIKGHNEAIAYKACPYNQSLPCGQAHATQHGILPQITLKELLDDPNCPPA